MRPTFFVFILDSHVSAINSTHISHSMPLKHLIPFAEFVVFDLVPAYMEVVLTPCSLKAKFLLSY